MKSIVSFFRHLFIPHKENDYKPHFFREHIVLSITIGSVLLLIISYTSYTVIRTTAFGSRVISSVLVELTNRTRIEHGVPPLKNNKHLALAATLKGDDMAKKQYFAHYAPDGTSPWYWFNKAEYAFLYAGENLAINFTTSDNVQKAWLKSPTHKENILDSRYEDIGIATVDGNLFSKRQLFVVQMFGKASSSASFEETVRSHVVWYQTLILNTPYYTEKIYRILVIIIILALFLMIAIEYKNQHYIHILYGVLLLLAVYVCSLLNSLFL